MFTEELSKAQMTLKNVFVLNRKITYQTEALQLPIRPLLVQFKAHVWLQSLAGHNLSSKTRFMSPVMKQNVKVMQTRVLMTLGKMQEENVRQLGAEERRWSGLDA